MPATLRAGSPRRRFLLPAFVLAAALALPGPAPLSSQSMEVVAGPGSADYRMAARFAPYKIREMVKSTAVQPRWIDHGDRFWYEWETTREKTFWIVDPAAGTRRQIFDNDRIAAELTRLTLDPWDGQHLPIRNIRFIDDNTLQFEVQSSQDEEVKQEATDTLQQERAQQRRPRAKKKVFHFEYDVATRTLRLLEDYEAPDNHPSWAGVAPDSSWVVFSRGFNLWAMTWDEYQKVLDARRGKSGAEADSAEWKLEGLEEIQLTTDGEKDYSWGSQGRGDNDEETEKEFARRQRAGVTWSHDARWFALTRQDRRKVGDLWVVHVVGNKRPQLESYKYDMPGEKNVTQTTLHVFDMQARAMKQIEDDAWKDQTMGVYSDPEGRGGFGGFGGAGSDEPTLAKWLSPESDELYFFRASRDLHRIDVMVADPATGAIRTVIEERMNTYQEQQQPWRLANGDLIWWSERDGWAHLYRIAPDGSVRHRLTEGPWHVDAIEGVNEARGYVLFDANGREAGEDPYYQHAYRVGLDGSGLTLLNPGDFDHQSSASESHRYFVDNYSRVNTVPTSALFDAGTGRKVMDLEEADLSLLLAAGYQFPEPYTVKAADGVTDLYGVMYKPFDFDPDKKYPIVEYVYPGPQTESVAKSFSTAPYETGLAQFGMIVVTVGNRGGNPDRSKWYHNYGYGNLRDYGLADKKAAAEQLADRHEFVDIDRVGIYGHSGGGFMSTAAMLVYPDFFKVAVSSSGNHENNVYNRWWSETHHGVKEVVTDTSVTFEYDIRKNSELAANLKGHLLLTTGDVDNNVHHAGTFRMAEALIKANKRFDFFVFPGQRHGYGNMGDYWYWLRAEYFVRHLLGDHTGWSADITQLQVESAKTR